MLIVASTIYLFLKIFRQYLKCIYNRKLLWLKQKKKEVKSKT